jgi:uncharacterized membrane protein YfcA
MNVAWYVPIGFFVGTYGTLIGAGGGFILVPLLVFLFPQDSPSMITAASLAVICVNATSGTIAYARMKRISYKTGVLFALATIPGALIGSYLTRFIPRKAFGVLFGALLMGVAVFITLTRGMGRRPRAGASAGHAGSLPPARIVDTVVDREGRSYPLSYDLRLGMLISFFVGCFSSLVGIGGGLIHVPVMTYVFGFPVHIATATSHFVLVFTSLAGVVEHLLDHTWPVHLLRDACLAAGIVAGAQLGAFFSRKVSSSWIVIGLAIALGLVGVRLLLSAIMG